MPVKTSKAYLTVLGKFKGQTQCNHKPERCVLLKQQDSKTHIYFKDHNNRCSLVPSLLHYNKKIFKNLFPCFINRQRETQKFV